LELCLEKSPAGQNVIEDGIKSPAESSENPFTIHPQQNGSASRQQPPPRQYTRKSRKRPAVEPETSTDLATLELPSTSASSFARNDISQNHVNEAPQNNGQSSSGAGSSTARSLPGGKEASEPKGKKKKKRSPVIIYDHITVISG
jgi:hypothetical protein